MRRDLGRNRPLAKARQRLDHGHLHPALVRSRSDFEADPAAADDDEVPDLREARTDCERIGDRAQVVHAWTVGAGELRPARGAAGAQDQLVVADRFAARERDALRRAID
jgi:hypothetical protein